jgi:RNAse (barnase) inhibitor barstar
MSHKQSKAMITLDAANWQTSQDFYRDFCRLTSAPKWFGNNLNAWRDSISAEGVLLLTPKKIIITNLSKKVKQRVGEKFFRDITDICAEMLVELEVYPEGIPRMEQ